MKPEYRESVEALLVYKPAFLRGRVRKRPIQRSKVSRIDLGRGSTYTFPGKIGGWAQETVKVFARKDLLNGVPREVKRLVSGDPN